VIHTRSHFVRNLLIMVVTLVSLIALAALCYLGIPHASQVAVTIEGLMRQERFDEAAKYLKKMPESQEYSEYEAVYYNLKRRLELYQTTYNAWRSFQESIGQGNLNSAAQYIGQLDLTRENAWNWDSATVSKRMDFARRCISIWLRYRELHSLLYVEPPVNPNVFHSIYADYSNDAQLKRAPDDPDWMAPLYKALDSDVENLHENCIKLNKLNAALEAVLNETGSYKDAYDMLSKLLETPGCLQFYFYKVRNVLLQLEASQKCIDENIDYVTNYRFEKIDMDPDFSSIEVCRLHPVMIKIRNKMVTEHYRVLNAGITVQWAHGRKFQEVLTADRIKHFQKIVNLSLSTSYEGEPDCFKVPLSQFLREQKALASKKDPDAPIGIDINLLFNVIQQTLTLEQAGYDYDAIGENKAMPLIQAARLLKEIYTFAMLPENKFLQKNKFKADIEKAGIVIHLHKSLADGANEQAEKNPGSRTYLIQKANYFFNSPTVNIPKAEVDRYRQYWKDYRRKLQDLLDQYDPLMDKAHAAQIRKQIF